jgi:protein-tyrosine phosphatase
MSLPYGNNADEILPGLWLGNFNSSQDEVFLQSKNINTVFNCTKDLPFSPLAHNRYRVPVDDSLQAEEIRNMELWSYEIIYKLVFEMKKGKPVLVHCAAGMQRSAAVVAMYLIATQKMSYDEAYRYIKQRRAIAFTPGTNFEKSIRGFYTAFQKEIRPQLDAQQKD